MKIKSTKVTTPNGLKARPLNYFFAKANDFPDTNIWLEKDGEERRVNAKSMLGVISLSIACGDTIKIIADGPKENEAIDALVSLIESNFKDEA